MSHFSIYGDWNVRRDAEDARRNNHSRRRHCIYCEVQLPDAAIFDAR